MMDKGSFLKEIRLKHKLSRKKISEILAVSPVTIERYESNKINITPTTKYIQGIYALYGYNPDIFNYDDITPELLEKYRLNDRQKQSLKDKWDIGVIEPEIQKLLKTATLSQIKEILKILNKPSKIEMGKFLENRFMKVN